MAPETLADTELSYLCKDLPLAHPQDGGADSSQDPGWANTGTDKGDELPCRHRCGA